MYALRPCDNCGVVGNHRKRGNGAFYCFECGIVRAVTAAAQMRDRSGPFYDAWLASPGPQGMPRGARGGTSTVESDDVTLGVKVSHVDEAGVSTDGDQGNAAGNRATMEDSDGCGCS